MQSTDLETRAPPDVDPTCSSRFSSDTDYSLDRVKLESFIERVETDSDGEQITRDPLADIQPQNAHESIKTWLQRVTQMQNEIQKKLKTEPKRPSRIVKYEDLPYMGEMTLENSKPRRGRKPKKADICHLIYKNYGTVFPGTPTKDDSDKKPPKIIGSLLEKRLTTHEQAQNEPLNLCIKDLNGLKIVKEPVVTKREPVSDDDVEIVETPRNVGVFLHPLVLQQQLYYNSLPVPAVQELRKLAPKPQASKRTAPSSTKTPAKRKRSAIFIPPIPPDNQTNPTTEVSICKFKFTGGAKPSLQEKKMLSVDSGGNFRYYSGTGDKSMRGYEFFPRETLQQQVESAHGSSTGAFLQASGERIYPVPASTPAELPVDLDRKKRKSRKSIQREKLEQTFKEKGFLIQTQQLESAEGATYCKFRQLRKFTRYLFRSWKDYLPGSVRELQDREEDEASSFSAPELN